VEVQDDLAKNYKSAKMAVAIELVKMAGFKSSTTQKKSPRKRC
jgi:hypothetical protein